MQRFGWVFIAITLVSAGCTPQELPEDKSSAAKETVPAWTLIPGTDDRILVLVAQGPTREAVVDVQWDDSAREGGMSTGFARAAEAVSTRAIYRFNCRTLQFQLQSYTVLSAKGESLTSQVYKSPKPSPVTPGGKGAYYLAAACGKDLSPKIRQRLEID